MLYVKSQKSKAKINQHRQSELPCGCATSLELHMTLLRPVSED